MARYRRTRRSKRSVRRSRRRPRRSFKRRSSKRRSLTFRQRPFASLGYLAPRKLSMTTKYCSGLLTASGAANYMEFLVNATSVYDPDVAVGGHQAMLFDEMMAMYDKFIVTASRITVEIYPTVSTATTTTQQGSQGVCFLTCNTNGNAMTPLDTRYLREQPNMKWGRWGNGGYGGRTNTNVISAFVKNSHIRPGFKISNPDCLGDVSSGPIDNNYWHFISQSVDESTAQAFQYRWSIVYWVTYLNVDDYITPS